MKSTALIISFLSLLSTTALAHPSNFAPNHAQLQKRCPPFDPAGVKNIGNGAGTQFIGGQCLSGADCASGCCANPCGICSGLGAQTQAGKTGCGFGGTGGGGGGGGRDANANLGSGNSNANATDGPGSGDTEDNDDDLNVGGGSSSGDNGDNNDNLNAGGGGPGNENDGDSSDNNNANSNLEPNDDSGTNAGDGDAGTGNQFGGGGGGRTYANLRTANSDANVNVRDVGGPGDDVVDHSDSKNANADNFLNSHEGSGTVTGGGNAGSGSSCNSSKRSFLSDHSSDRFAGSEIAGTGNQFAGNSNSCTEND